MTLTLYHCTQSRSMRVLWMIEELGLDAEIITLAFPPRWLDPDYLKINPLGTIPLLIDGEVRMTESSAACHYLAVRYGRELHVEEDDAAFADYLQWLSFSEATLTFPLALVLRYSVLEPEEKRQPKVARDYQRFFAGRLVGPEAALADGRPWICGERFSAADIAMGYALHLGANFKLEEEFPPAVGRYWQRLKARPAYSRALR